MSGRVPPASRTARAGPGPRRRAARHRRSVGSAGRPPPRRSPDRGTGPRPRRRRPPPEGGGPCLPTGCRSRRRRTRAPLLDGHPIRRTAAGTRLPGPAAGRRGRAVPPGRRTGRGPPPRRRRFRTDAPPTFQGEVLQRCSRAARSGQPVGHSASQPASRSAERAETTRMCGVTDRSSAGIVDGVLRPRLPLLEDRVRIGAAEPEGGHTGPSGPVAQGGPAGRLGDHAKAQCREVDVRVGVVEVQTGRNTAVAKGQRGLDQADDARRAFQVAQVALHRSDQQGPVGTSPCPATDPRAVASMGSPKRVPVPCVST